MATARRVVLASLAVWVACVVLQWLVDPPLAHDEAAYAVLGLEGLTRWAYRPIGMVELARIGLVIGHSGIALRAPSVILGLAFVPAVAYLGRRFGEWTGAWTAALVVGSHTFVMRGFQLLNDIPAATCVLVATAIALDELTRDEGPRYRLVLAAPLCAISIYLRYGNVLPIGVIALIALIMFRSWLRRPAPIAVFAVVLVVLLVPLFALSRAKTGSALGLFEFARAAATYPTGQGLRRFVIANPLLVYGALVAPVMLVGLFGARDRREWLLAISSIVLIGWLGLTSDGSTRFLFVPMIFLVIVGVRRLEAWLANRTRARRIAIGLVLAGWLSMIVAVVPIQQHIARGVDMMMTASRAIRADAAGRPCVVMAYWVTDLIWYSGCDGIQAPTWEAPNQIPSRDVRCYAASMPQHPVNPDAVARALGARAVPLSGGTAWLLER